MPSETTDIEELYESVSSVQELGTGRKRKSFFVGDTEDARTATLIFAGYVYQNWWCHRKVTLRNGDRLLLLFWSYTKAVDGSFTVSFSWNGKAVFLFYRNELTEDLWQRQLERAKLWEWFRTAKPQDRVAMAELVVEQTESGYRGFCRLPQFTGGVLTGWRTLRFPSWPDLARIEIEIMKLSVPALRKLNSVTSVDVMSSAKTFAELSGTNSSTKNESSLAA
jgi:hypothetical protein